MRKLGIALLVSGLLLSGCGSDGPSAGECPAQAAEYRSYIGENDNPAPDGLPRLSASWEDLYRELGTLRKSSQGEVCAERLPTVKREVRGINKLSYDLQEFDPVERSDEAKAVRAYIADKDLKGDPGIRHAARVDKLAPAAQKALAPAFAKADAVDPSDKGAVRDALAEVKQVARTDPAAQAWLAALDRLDVGEYDEP